MSEEEKTERQRRLSELQIRESELNIEKLEGEIKHSSRPIYKRWDFVAILVGLATLFTLAVKNIGAISMALESNPNKSEIPIDELPAARHKITSLDRGYIASTEGTSSVLTLIDGNIIEKARDAIALFEEGADDPTFESDIPLKNRRGYYKNWLIANSRSDTDKSAVEFYVNVIKPSVVTVKSNKD